MQPTRKHKKIQVATGKPPAPGERKAMRKRVVLSNTSALPVQGLRNLEKENVESFASIEGQMAGLPDATVDALRALDAFKPTQGWGTFYRPATMIRPETTRLFDLIKLAEREGPTEDRSWRLILHGERGSGKSVIQVQTMAAAHLKGWLLIHIAEAQDLTIGHTTYIPTPSKAGRTMYIQPDYAAELLGKIHKANIRLLSTMQLAHTHQLGIPLQSNISLARLVELGATDPLLAYPVWQAFLKEVTTPSQAGDGLQRPPVLITVDGTHHIMRDSHYVQPDLKPIHAQDFSIVADISNFLNGTTKLGNGGIVLASTSSSNRPEAPTFDYLLAERLAKAQAQAAPRWDAYAAIDSKVENAIRGVEVMHIGGISKKETKNLMEYYALSGMLRRYVANHLVGEKWAVSGGGIIGALERACVLERI